MTKYEFLGDLSRLLSDLPEEERRQAMKYYEDYFADAGEGQEQEVLSEFGSPEEIARKIKADLSENIEYGEGSSAHMQDFIQPYASQEHNTQNNGKQNNQQTQNFQQNAQNHTGQNQWQNEQARFTKQGGKAQNKTSPDPSRTALIIIIAIVTSPIWGTVLVGIISLVIGVLSAILGIFSALILGGGGVAIGGIACVFGGIIAGITGEIASGLLVIGIGCVLFVVGAICCYLGIMLCIKLIPAIWRECVRGFEWGKEQLNRSIHA